MKYLALILLLLLSGCANQAAKDIVRNKHAQSYVIAKRLNDEDPNNDPTHEQLKQFTKSTAKDWESMDRILNDWKPSGGMQSVDLEGKVHEGPIDLE